MAVNIKFWQFAKKENSTKKPETDGTAYSCLLKEPVNLMNPIITLQHDNPVGYNYAYISTFGRYYFVTNWTYERGLWYAELRVDALASWKAEIGESTQYVLRSASNYDVTIIDTMYPCFSGDALETSPLETNPYPSTFAEGYYIMGIINADINAVGATSYYCFTHTQMLDFKEFLLGNSSWFSADVTDISENLQKELFNPFSYITSCTWLPFKPALESVSSTTLPFGWWYLKNMQFGRVTPNLTIPAVYVFDIPQHRQIQTRGSFVQRSSEYSDFTLFFPPYGMIHLPAEMLAGSTKLYVKTDIDPITGIGHIIVSPFQGFTSIIAYTSAQVGMPISIAQINDRPLTAASSIVGGIAGAGAGVLSSIAGILTNNPISAISGAAAIQSSVANAAIGTTQALAPVLQSTGTTGTLSGLQFTPELRARFRVLVDEDLEHFGRPYCKAVKIQTLSGFIKCSSADISTNATAQENVMINNYLNGGFFYE